MQGTIRGTKHYRSFTIAELIIAMVVIAILLAATAVTFNASIVNYTQNENIFKTTNMVRQALLRITSQLRTAIAVDPNAPNNECSLITAGGDDLTYRYNSTDNKLYLDNNDTSNSYMLCNNKVELS